MSSLAVTDKASTLRWAIVVTMAALAALCIAWEIALAPLRPGAWMLSLKALPLLLALPGMVAGKVRTMQWWSMLTMLYLTEGLVRATSESGAAVPLAWLEAILATIAFGLILAWCRIARAPNAQPAT